MADNVPDNRFDGEQDGYHVHDELELEFKYKTTKKEILIESMAQNASEDLDIALSKSAGINVFEVIPGEVIPGEEWDTIIRLTTDFSIEGVGSLTQNNNPTIVDGKFTSDGSSNLSLSGLDFTQDTWWLHSKLKFATGLGRQGLFGSDPNGEATGLLLWYDEGSDGKLTVGLGNSAWGDISGWLPTMRSSKNDFVNGQEYDIDICFDKNLATENYKLFISGHKEASLNDTDEINNNITTFYIGKNYYDHCHFGFSQFAFNAGGVVPSSDFTPTNPENTEETQGDPITQIATIGGASQDFTLVKKSDTQVTLTKNSADTNDVIISYLNQELV